ncbi:exportin-5-like [Nilaparvata lugens]|uniref:exportin-5-like n=1 Tax=Nilaparvata lugens TaxID=108931 RepID=UPI00193CDDDD|nr:exportin-5-like [Nilaparvata lugens]XP_039280029.1 exportin-5-like [Nilaparvata lugens]
MDEVGVLAGQLAAAVELTMDPAAPHSQRHEAYSACEQFKEKSPLCVQCGLYLVQRQDYSHFVRHFGLQLMEHCIKYRWYNLVQAEKLFIKENAMKLVEAGTVGSHVNDTHLKDALSRVIVEMIKREWPQQWPTLLAELNEAAKKGCVQTELVLLVFLRLVEDVAVFQTLESNTRRKDLYQALTTKMGEIFGFFLDLIEKHCEQYRKANESGSTVDASSHARVVQVVLLTLSGFVEWVSMTHIMANDGRLLQVLCLLLNNELFQSLAAECLLQIVSRKGKVDERKPLLVLFSADAMQCMFQSADGASAKPLEEAHYHFLKKLTQVLTGLGMQLCTLWGKEGTPGCPPNFSIYLEAILTFSRHPSLSVAHFANTLWLAFFKHDHISKDPILVSFIPKWVQASGPKLMKVVYNKAARASGRSDDVAAYVALDCDSEEEFNVFFHRVRVDLLDTFKQATLVAPLVTYRYVQDWLVMMLQKTMSTPTDASQFVTVQSPSFMEWDALTLALDSVLSKILMCVERPPVGNGLQLLDLCLAFEPIDPLILSSLLSCISALFVFLSMAPPETSSGYLLRVLDKIFASLVFTQGGDQDKWTQSRSVKNVRRHAASLMVKIGHKYPLLLLPIFDRVCTIVSSLEPKLSKMEYICLQEALLLISNHFCEYDRESNFVGEVLRPVSGQWISMAKEAFCSPQQFMSFVGLDKPPVEPSAEDIYGQNRAQIICCVNVLQAVVKRCVWPDDPDRAQRGGFVVARTEAWNPIYRNPATPHFLPLFPGLLTLIQCFNSLWTPPALALLSEGYKSAYDMLEVDRNNLLGITTQSQSAADCLDWTQPPKTPIHRIQNFMTAVHDTSYHVLGAAFQSIGRDLYQLPNLATTLLNTVFSNLDFISDFRLRPIIRVFLKPFIMFCPVDFYDSVLLPVLAQFTPFILNRLNRKWQHMTDLLEAGGIDDENADAQECLEDMLNRQITREFLDVMKVTLVGGSGAEGAGGATTSGGSPAMDDELNTRLHAHTQEVIGELGMRVLTCPHISEPVVSYLLSCVAWNDSTASLKAVTLVGPVVRFLLQERQTSAHFARQALTLTLYALQTHGQHDANLGSLLMLGTQLYEMLRPKYSDIIEVMKQIPDINLTDLQKFDDKMLEETRKGNKIDKAKREMFKKLTNPLIGCNMGQLFRRKAFIRDLPRIEAQSKKINPNLLDEADPGIKLFDHM